MRYQAYSSYKQLDNHWLDKIPTHWTDSKVKFEALFQVGWTPPTSKDENFIGDNLWANISDLKTKTITNTVKRISDEAAQKASMEITPIGSLLYSFKLSVGARAFANVDLYTNEAIASFLPQYKNSLNYLYYAFGEYIIKNAAENIYGAKILNQDLIKNAFIALPKIEEQVQIAAFLDRETAVIDTLIAKQEELIGLLKEKRTAVIGTAVTKGINPHAPLKDSGIEWLGQVPTHWRLPKVGYHAIVTKLTGFEYTNYWEHDEQGTIFALRGFNIGERKLDLKKTEKITAQLSTFLSRSKLYKNDVVMPCTGTLGNAAVIDADETYHINQNIAKVTFDSYIDPYFATYWFISSNIRLKMDMNNMSGMQPVLLISDIRKLPLVLPPLSEQKTIIDFLNKQTWKYNNLIIQALNAVELLKERRTALISAAVTGKIDVRQA